MHPGDTNDESTQDRIHYAEDTITTSQSYGGVYSMRERPSFPPGALSKHNSIASEKTADSVGAGSTGELHHRQDFKGRYLLWLAYQSVGVIYGDIGTSPLYVYSSTFSSDPSYDDLLGALSLIIWTLTLMVTVKYVLIVLRSDDEGEGGTFAVYSLLSRYANIVRRDPREERSVKFERVKTTDLKTGNQYARSFLEKSVFMQTLLKVVGVFGVSLIMSDGVLTPAQSVLGAIQGLKVVNEDISTATIVGTSCAILVLLFLIQPLGVTKIGSTFAPVVMIWLLFNLCFGIYNLAKMDHSVLKAFSPAFAIHFFTRNKTDGWRMLGGILLSFTGVEALFADLGAFSRRAVQLSWLCFAYPCLLLAYIGQAAYISKNPSAYSNPFFNSTPPGMFYPSLVIAILAAVVASQTMITATFQLLSQIIKLSYFPQIKIIHTSKIFHNQIYIPWVNWLLMVGTVCVTAAYNNTTKLGEAYGVCVILVTFITTCMVSLVALVVWRLPIWLVLPCFLVFGTLDGLYLSSALTKVPDGAWFTLCLAVFLSSIFVLWRFGKENQWQAEASDNIAPWNLFFVGATSHSNKKNPMDTETYVPPPLELMPAFGGGPISRLRGIGVFFDKTGSPNSAPAVFVHFIQKFQAAPAVTVFFNIRPLPCPTVAAEDRFSVSRCPAGMGSRESIPDFYRMTVRHGYADRVMTHELNTLIYENLRRFIIREGSKIALTVVPDGADDAEAKPKDDESGPQESLVRRRLEYIRAAYEDQAVNIVGKEQMRIGEMQNCRGWFRRIALAAFLWLRSNTGSRVSNMNLDVEKVVEVGFVKIM